MIIIRRATIADKQAIFDFIKEAYSDRWESKIPYRWEWLFIENPFVDSGNLPIWIAEDENRKIVGQTCAMEEIIKFGDNTYKIGWGVDFVVNEKYRGQGIGTKLIDAYYDSYEIFMALSMAHISRKILSNLAFHSIDPVPTYLRQNILDPDRALNLMLRSFIPKRKRTRKVLAKILGNVGIGHLSALIHNKNLILKDAKQANMVDKSITVEETVQLDREFDQLWDEVSPHFHALIKRDHLHLNWKFLRQPHVQHKIFIARRQGKLLGYTIVRKGEPPEPHIGIIVDIFVSPNEMSTITALISKAVDYFTTEKVRSILVTTSVSAYLDCLKSFGFTLVRETVPMVYVSDFDDNRQVSLKPGEWLLSQGDHDWNQYPSATDEV
jgi:GNAT superfamily N-acetyltransferase